MPNEYPWKRVEMSYTVSREELARDQTVRETRHTLGVIFWIRAALALCILALAALPLFAHSWYDPACCGGNDCAPITALAVTAGPDGWHVRLKEGEHPMVTNGPIDAIVPYGKELRSQDGNFHACVRDQSSPSNVMAEPIICLYVPDVGSA